jgi:hypothetical protein
VYELISITTDGVTRFGKSISDIERRGCALGSAKQAKTGALTSDKAHAAEATTASRFIFPPSLFPGWLQTLA